MPDQEKPASLEEVISRSIDEATQDDEETQETQDTVETSQEASGDEDASEEAQGTEESSETPQEAAEDSTEVSEEQTAASESTDGDETASTDEEFDKRHGVQSRTKGGKVNRIPYPRVQKIVENAERMVREELETEFKPDRERLDKWGKFEELILTRPDDFIQFLATVPAYKPFFENLNAVLEAADPKESESATSETTTPSDGMPPPNKKLADGTKVYDDEGLRQLLEWQSKQVESRVTSQFSEEFGPIKEEYDRMRYLQTEVLPKVQQQAEEARKWPMFIENEAAIAEKLKENKGLSLHDAYREVVIPKLQASKDEVRKNVLKELKTAPKSTTAPTQSVAPRKEEPAPGTRDLTSVIREEVKKLETRLGQ